MITNKTREMGVLTPNGTLYEVHTPYCREWLYIECCVALASVLSRSILVGRVLAGQKLPAAKSSPSSPPCSVSVKIEAPCSSRGLFWDLSVMGWLLSSEIHRIPIEISTPGKPTEYIVVTQPQ